MRFQLLSATILGLLAGLLTPTISVYAEAHCPENIASVTPRLVAGALIVIPVKINNAGPFDFMVDTGSQLTVIDPALARQLDIQPEGSVGMVAAAGVFRGAIGLVEKLEAASHVVKGPQVVVLDLGQIQAADPRIRGVLGENFLTHFDVLIDYPHRLVCLDDSGAMQGSVRGERIPLVTSTRPQDELPFTQRLVIAVTLSDTGKRRILLQLDSGSDGSIIYAGNRDLEIPLLRHATLRGNDTSAAQREFALLPPQDMRLGSRTISRIRFVTPVQASLSIPNREEDGILPTVLFQRVYINNSDHYVVFDPK